MLTENIRKHIKKLTQKKYREEFREFLVEGVKGVEEALVSGLEITTIILEDEKTVPVELPLFVDAGPTVLYASKSDVKEIKTTETFPGIMAIVKMPTLSLTDFDFEAPIICLDGVKDPGNLGTIIRSADWFGVKNILLSEDCVDTYNEKVVRSTMGSIFRSKIFESKNLVPDLKILQGKEYTVVGMQMAGDSIKDLKFNKKTVCVFGSESHGISIQVQTVLNQSCTIPRIGEAESLNVAIAAGIVLSKIAL
ncbi:MAG: hypothetical protein A3B90_02955 [Candidatus Magasanikbacteria bacterium RIFCSPHIGHO2_02_FULL_41_13]|uniref:Uncharacterized protein n=1 Tax=Candidatus Magasanikbacteria bacterium RIFCSPHIGHO2_02_FULL_41_13 TaxID=1798676 RepID=A0A1F6M2Z0_9BACT|nr:MAG: hypothetical protein A3B90_02955 [Candidatus Magasanikbacteria bacterium RIFCSPHIGHO2_02_FULL_41_13]